ncbi:MAG: peptidase MA family metallohydrolase, partial [Chloroflexota bacterium]
MKPSYGLSSRWIRGLLLALALLVAGLAPTLAQAPPSAPAIAAPPQVEARFPTAIAFSLSATSQSPITRAVLRYRLDRIGCFEELVDRHPEFSPSTELEVSWTLDMRKIGGLPTGARLRYQWLVEDAAGNRQATPEKVLRFEDTRYSWRNLRQGMVTLYWYRGNEAFASRLLAAAQAALDRLSQDTGTRLERPVELYIYESAAALRQARVFPQAWEGGVAFPAYGVVAIGVAQDQVQWGEGAVAHELAHLGIYQMSFNCYQDLPTWLNEGLATYAEGDPAPDQRLRLQQAIAANQLISVRSLSSSFPADPEQARLSYAESRSLVAFLIEKYGQEKMTQLLSA